ncbi:MAG: aspartate kinase [Thermoguttaceae bacterium]
MSIIVQKFGGTSVADSEKILAAARKAIRARKEGNQVLVVVSAMGKNTDMLVGLAQELSDNPPAREMDMLLSTGEQVSVALMAMAIHSLGHDAVSMTGAQMGIVTDSAHTKARIQSISTERIQEAFSAGKIVIAAGFQGVDESFNITTLGRGGSDTTAVALAAVLGADACEIYTDVDGIYTTDPRIVPEARRVNQISYDEMLELASSGAGVMHNRSIEFAKKFSVPVHVRSSMSDSPGTMIVAAPGAPDVAVCGAAVAKDEAQVTVLGVPDRPGAAMAVFSGVAAKHIAMDMIVQNVGADGKADISFTVPRNELPAIITALETVVGELGAEGIVCDDEVSKVSVVGLGMVSQTGVAKQMFRALGEAGINIMMITTSEIKISVLLARSQAQDALRVVHESFQLDREPPRIGGDRGGRGGASLVKDAAEIVARMERMEELIVDDIALDDSQAMLTFVGVDDRPGLAAKVFEEIAAGGIIVDMIVQSISRQGHANISVTVQASELDKSFEVVSRVSKKLGCPPPSVSPKVAKLSVFGVGMRSHTGVASRMFQSLAAEGINVNVISTSEVRVNVVIDGRQGQKGLDALEKEFADVIV